MNRTPFNDGWRVRPKANPFMEMFGGGRQPSEAVHLPHDAMLGGVRDPDGHWGTGFFPGGIWEYEKSFAAPEALRGRRVLLEFEGVFRSASVRVNGALVGHRPYGYSEFTVSIGEHLEFGQDNVVKVSATSHDDARWYSGAGIFRPVHLVVGDPVRLALDGVTVVTPHVDDEGAVVVVSTLVENESLATTSTTVTTEIVDVAGAVVARDVAPLTVFPGRSEELRQRLFVASPRRWSVESPTLYTCRTRLDAEEDELEAASTTFGIRTIEVDPDRGLRINGEPVALRGACIHHDNGVIGAATIRRADERRVEILQEAGFNALRSAHHPMSRDMLDVCDRLGMLVMDEAFDVWTESKMDDDYAQAFPDWWPADVDAMVHKDRNHPSVIIYSIGNEIPDVGTPAGAALGRAITDRIRALDPTRLVTNSINPLLACGPELFAQLGMGAPADSDAEPANMDVNTMMTMMDQYLPIILQQEVVDERTAEAYAYLDVCGYNYTESRYRLDHELHPQRVIVGSETNPKNIAANWGLVREHSHVIGDFTWTGWDYLGESGIGRVRYESDPPDAPGGLMAPYPWIAANVGDIDITGFRRPVSYWREIVWGLRDAPYLAVRPPEHHGEESTFRGGWSFTDAIATWSWPGFEGQAITVEVYADADEVELLINGESSGRSKVGEKHPFVAEFETTYTAGELVAVAYRDGTETGRVALASARGPVLLDVQADRPRIDATDRDLAFVDIALVDGDGNVHGEDRAVTVAVDGPAVLQGFGSGNPCTEETFGAPTHDTYNGRALAVIRPTGAGTIAVTVSAEGCDDRTVTIEAGEPVTWELRWHPFRAEWVLFTAHRGARPWIGETVPDDEPAVPDDNALAPLGRRIATTNPDYRGVFVFTNDLPVFSPDAPEPDDDDDVYRARRAVGTAEVVCYHHDPTRSMADLDDDEVTVVVETWRERTRALQAFDGVAHVLIFENRGAAVGTSNPHPHCQIYAGALVYGTTAREAEVAAEHHQQTGRSLLTDVVERERTGTRVVSDGDHFFACVPWFARYAYEVHVLPRRPVASLLDLVDDECRSLALVLRDVVRRYDALWGIRMPYVLAVHQAPVGEHPHYPFHVELHPPLRAPGLLKYLAGPEIGGGSMTNESDPDEKAAELRDALS